MSLRCVALSCALSVAAVGVGASPAHATFPGANGAIAYSEWPYDANAKAYDFAGLSTLRSIAPDGSGDRLLYKDSGYNMGEPAWSPDGTRLAWSGYGGGKFDGVYVDTPAFAELNLVAKSKYADGPSWSPDGSTIVYANDTKGLFTVPANGSASPTRLVASPKRYSLTSPVYSPDGRTIAYGRSATTQKASRYHSDLWTANADGTAARPLLGGGGSLKFAGQPDISPDGTQLVFHTYGDGSVRSALYVSAINGTAVRKLATAPGSTTYAGAVWSPDGTKLVVSRLQPTVKRGSALLLVDPTTGSQTVLRRVKRGFLMTPNWQALPAAK